MLSSGLLRHVALVRTDVSKEPSASIIRVTVGELGTTFFTLMTGGDTFLRNASSYRATRCHIPEDDILHSHCRGNLKSYIALTGWNL
jgi:hypothetical protein